MENLILNIISISIAVPITVYWYIKDSKKAKKPITKMEDKNGIY